MTDIMKNIIFYLGMGTLFTHELDAMTNHEWRVLPLTSWMPDEYGALTFLLLHIPIFAVLIALVASRNEKIRFRSKIGISVFLIVHALFHILCSGNVNYEFVTITSNILIFGGAALGLVYSIMEFIERRAVST